MMRLLLALVLVSAGCAAEDHIVPPDPPPAAEAPPLETYADSLAMRAYEATGGPAAWAALPYLGFHFSAERDGQARPAVRHLWNRQTGDYRVEMPGGEDTTYVVLFNVETRDGQAFLDGAPLDSAASAARVEQAYERFINDTYWLMAPAKLFDPGVSRTFAADSSDATTDVLHLAFDGVGLTPGDQYWLFIDKDTGRVTEWAYRLQSGREARWRWTGYEEHTTEGGTLAIATRKESPDGAVAILTDHVSMPAEVPPARFTDPSIP